MSKRRNDKCWNDMKINQNIYFDKCERDENCSENKFQSRENSLVLFILYSFESTTITHSYTKFETLKLITKGQFLRIEQWIFILFISFRQPKACYLNFQIDTEWEEKRIFSFRWEKPQEKKVRRKSK